MCGSSEAPGAGSSSTSVKLPAVSAAIGEREDRARSSDFGVITTSGRRTRRFAWARRRWKYCAARRRLGDRDVLASGERKEPLEAGGGVLGALALVAVGQQEHDAGGLAPLLLGRDDEVVDHDLRAVGEVAELRLPGDEGVGRLDRVAVLETEHRVLREQRVTDGEAPAPGRRAAAGHRRPTRRASPGA